MPKFLKRMLVICLSICMLIPRLSVPSFAAGQKGGVQSRLDQLLKEWPSGAYFSVNRKACTEGSMDSEKHMCSNCNVINIVNEWPINGTNRIAGQGACWTCNALPAYAFYYVFGKQLNRYANCNLISKGKITDSDTFSNVLPGDIILFYNGDPGKNLKDYGHMGVIMGLNQNGFQLYDCNVNGINKICYHNVPYSAYGGWSYVYIYRAKNYDEINNASITTEKNEILESGNMIGKPTKVEEESKPTVITFNSLTVPEGLTVGYGGHIDGSITSSNSPICSVKAYVYTSDGSKVMSASTSGFSVSTYGPIKGSKIDNDLRLNELSAGTYYIKYTVTTEDGTTSFQSTDTFQIKAKKETVPTTISFRSLTVPDGLTVGTSGHVDGSITSSNSPICAVKAYVYNSNGTMVMSASTSGFSVTTYGPIKNSKIDSNLLFNELPAGTYYIKYIVTTEDGTTSSQNTDTFQIR